MIIIYCCFVFWWGNVVFCVLVVFVVGLEMLFVCLLEWCFVDSVEVFLCQCLYYELEYGSGVLLYDFVLLCGFVEDEFQWVFCVFC